VKALWRLNLEASYGGAGTRPPLIELVEMPVGSAPSLRCGGLDKLDQRVVASPRMLRRLRCRWL